MGGFNWRSLSGGRGPLRRESWEPEGAARPDADVIKAVITPAKPRESEKERIERLAAELRATLDYNDALARERKARRTARAPKPLTAASRNLLARSRYLLAEMVRAEKWRPGRIGPCPIDWRTLGAEADLLASRAHQPSDANVIEAMQNIAAVRMLLKRLRARH